MKSLQRWSDWADWPLAWLLAARLDAYAAAAAAAGFDFAEALRLGRRSVMRALIASWLFGWDVDGQPPGEGE